MSCGSGPLKTTRHCFVCAPKVSARRRRYALRTGRRVAGPGRNRCSRCNDLGHNVKTCEVAK